MTCFSVGLVTPCIVQVIVDEGIEPSVVHVSCTLLPSFATEGAVMWTVLGNTVERKLKKDLFYNLQT